MNITLRQLRVFIEVARLRSFSRAGDEIGLTQSAVSRCVRELEGEIGLKLIDRTTRDVQLTDVGVESDLERVAPPGGPRRCPARDSRDRRTAARPRGGGGQPDDRLPSDASRGGGRRAAVPVRHARAARRRAERRAAQGEVGRGRFRRGDRAAGGRRPGLRTADDRFVLPGRARRSSARDGRERCPGAPWTASGWCCSTTPRAAGR